MPNTVTSIGDEAFKRCWELSNVDFSKGLESIGESSFYYCSELTSIQIPNSVTSIGRWAFLDCTSLMNITHSANLERIGQNAFSDTPWLEEQYKTNEEIYISKVLYYGGKIPEDVHVSVKEGTVSICEGAFSSRWSLQSISIPKSVIHIGYHTFYLCGLDTVYYAGTEEEWSKIEIQSGNDDLNDATVICNYEE